MKKIQATLAFCTAFATQAWAAGLIVVEDLGGASALPYYQGLDPQPSAAAPGPGDLGVRGSGAFPVRSARLSPGQVQGAPSTLQACNRCSWSATTHCLEPG